MSSRTSIEKSGRQEKLFSFEELLNALPAAIYVCDAAGYVIKFNEPAARLWGREPVIGTDLWCGSWKIYDLDGTPIPLCDCPMAETLRSGKAVVGKEIIIEQPGGQRFNVLPHPRPLFDADGKLVGAANMLLDVSHQNRFQRLEQRSNELATALEALRTSEERYNRMVSEVEDYAIILLSSDGIIENWNKGAQKIKGYSAEEIIGKHFSIFYVELDRRNRVPELLLQEARTRGKAIHEGWRVRKDGSRFFGSVVITALHNDEGDMIGFTKVTRDLTEKKRAEEELLATSLALEQKNRELERMNQDLSSFAYISSHDLQEPLRKIQTFADRIVETEFNNLSEKGKDYFRRMQGGAARMQKLIRDILAYSRTATTEKIFEEKDLNELLAHTKAELEVGITEKNAVIENDNLPTIKVIPFQIQQLFNNLLNNALKFSRRDVRPHIRIACEIVSGKNTPYPELAANQSYCHISFADNGIGFEPEYNNKIFEVFQRLHARSDYAGTGIGLAICKKIVENHNGFIYAESRPGEGATFHIYLPVG